MSQGLEHWRLFAALPLPGRLRPAVEAVQSELRRAVPEAAIRWTPAEQWHLTLRFLGSVAAGRVEELKTAMASVCAHRQPLELRLAGVGCFPHAHQPRVLWLGVEGDAEGLQQLYREVCGVVDAYAEKAVEAETFAAHLTLGRVKLLHPLERRGLAAAVERLGRTAQGQWSADRVCLMRSELGPGGARHACLAEWRWAGKERA